ncbi:hypothetical protein V8D89_001372 [Ganoderma adspersum]
MTSIAAIDTLIAAFYPFIYQYQANGLINPSSSLQPSERYAAIHKLVDSFAELFGFYPHCETVAVAVQTPPRGRMSLYVCPSAPTPAGFDTDVRRWFEQFMAARKGPAEQVHCSEGEHFIIDIYSLCYGKMREWAIHQDYIWSCLTKPSEPKDEEGRQLEKHFHAKLVQLSMLVGRFLKIMSLHEANLGNDTLQFHALCLQIRDTMKDKEFEKYINRYLYIQGVDRLLQDFFRLPVAISNLLTIPGNLDLPFDDEHPTIVVDPKSQGIRNFRAVLAVKRFRECFGGGVDWDGVLGAFVEEDAGNYSQGLDWNDSERVLSTGTPVTPHPEVTLLQNLLNNVNNRDSSSKPLEFYIACSTTPCYATVIYVGVVNDVLEAQGGDLRFTMRTDNQNWCRLSTAEPWLLPESTGREVLEELKGVLLGELQYVMDVWEKEKVDIGRD